MKAIKRNGDKMEITKERLLRSLTIANDDAKRKGKKYTATPEMLDKIAVRLYERCRKRIKPTRTEEIRDMIELELMKEKAYETARRYMRRRYLLEDGEEV